MKLFFSVGEPSGDHHTARLVRELQRRVPEIEARGFGGPHMAQAGVELLYPLTDLAVMGFKQVVPLIQKFRGLVRQAEAHFQADRPDAVVLVDFPGFNWWIAKAAKKLGIPVIYYCPPQLWAWAAWRIHKVRKYVDHVLTSLPFEAEWYQQRGIAAECVGHPFFDDVAETQLDSQVLQELRHPGGPMVAVLPGSRRSEVEHNFPIQMQVMRLVQQQVPGVRFLIANYREQHREWCTDLARAQGADLPLEFHVGKNAEILSTAQVCLMKSGSSTLEVLARAIPAVVHYHADWPTYLIGRALVTCEYMSLPNLMVERELMPEFLLVGRRRQHIPAMARHLSTWLLNPAMAARHLDGLAELRATVAQSGGTIRAAAAILRCLGFAEESATTSIPFTTPAQPQIARAA